MTEPYQMTSLGLLVLLAVLIFDESSSQESVRRNTIFNDEKLQGGTFEKVDYFGNLSPDNVSPYRLPVSTKPVHYDILWAVNITGFSFSGEVDIYLHATQADVDEIVLHAHDLTITSLNLYLDDVIVFRTYTLQLAYHFLRVRLTNGTLEYNQRNPVLYRMSVAFEAELRSDMHGLYRSWFKNNYTDRESWIATTFFAPTSARSAFPCYDEPSFKATFNITVRRPTTHHSWSCTELDLTKNSTDSDYKDDVFYKTPRMSTYIVAITVADFNGFQGNSTLLHEVIGRRTAINDNQAVFAQDVGIKLLTAMSLYTEIDYYSVSPKLKMSHVAIPDFSAGAMENWGLLTYREALLMAEGNQTSSQYKQRIASIISHEIAHMWFGNLVSCHWWSFMWLKEGFARFYQYYLTDMVVPYMEFPVRFVPEQVHTALLSDSADDPHPLSNPNVGSPDDVSAMYSTITYNKGAAVIRMTEQLLGTEVFREGIRKYLKKRYLETALPVHFFEALQEAAEEYKALSAYGADFNIVDYYKTWTEQGGHPVLRVNIDHSTGLMMISQAKFNINTGYATATRNWIIPINFATSSNPHFNDTKPSHIIRHSVTVIERMAIGDQWTILNKQQVGFYRVLYDDYTWNLNIIALRTSQRDMIHENNRAQIIDDVFQFARSGLMSYTRAFNVMSFLLYETSYAPWAAAIAGFNWLSNRLAGSPLESQVNELFALWAQGVMIELTYYPIEGESFSSTLLRQQLALIMCRLGNVNCLKALEEQFGAFIKNRTEIHRDNRNWVYCNGLRYGSREHFDVLWDRYLSHSVYNEKIQILTALGCTQDESSLNKLLDAIVQKNFDIRPQDYGTAFNSAVNGNEKNTQIVFTYIQNNLCTVIDAFGSPITPLSFISARLRTPEDVDEFRNWVVAEQAVLAAGFQEVYQSAQAALEAIEWVAEVENDIKNYLVNGDELLIPSTPPTVDSTSAVDNITPHPIIEPSTPDLGNSSNKTSLSLVLIMSSFFVIPLFIEQYTVT